MRPWLPALAWMGLIFALSADAQSGETSGRAVALVRQAWMSLAGTPPEAGTLEALHLGLRKVGHLVEYGVLYALIWRARVKTGKGPGWNVPFVLTVLYAVTDEIHQSFVPNRVGSPGDVAVDAAGAAFAALLVRAGVSRDA